MAILALAACKIASAEVLFQYIGAGDSVHSVWAPIASITARLRGFCLCRDEYLCRPVTKLEVIGIAAVAGGTPVTMLDLVP